MRTTLLTALLLASCEPSPGPLPVAQPRSQPHSPANPAGTPDEAALPAERPAVGSVDRPAGRAGRHRGSASSERFLHTAARSHAVPEGAPTVFVQAASNQPAPWVFFLHGWNGCVRALAGESPSACRPGDRRRVGYNLGQLHLESGTNTVLVIPQLSWLARDGSPGRFDDPSFLDLLVDEIAQRTGRASPIGGPYTLIAHSAGYETALAILRHHGEVVANLVFLDALYAGAQAVAQWMCSAPDRRVITMHTGRGGPARQSRLLLRAVRACEINTAQNPADLEGSLQTARAVSAETATPHGTIPRAHFAEILRTLYRPSD